MVRVLVGLKEAAAELESEQLAEELGAIRDALQEPKTLQRRHRAYLSTLADLMTG